MRVGKLRHRVSVRSLATAAADTFGQLVATPADSGPYWAEVRPASVRERVAAADQLKGEISHVVTMRNETTITPEHQLIYGTRTLNVVAARDPDERGAWLVIECVEVKTGV